MATLHADKLRPCMGAHKFSDADIARLEARVAKVKSEHTFEDANHAYIEAATQIASEARSTRGMILDVLTKEDAAKTATPAPQEQKSKHDNVPDLADALAKERGLPQAVADAYVQHQVLGRSHAQIAGDLGVGKSTAGDWIRQMGKLVDEATPTRLERDTSRPEAAGPGEAVAPEGPVAVDAGHVAEEGDNNDQAETSNADESTGEVHADMNSAGELAAISSWTPTTPPTSRRRVRRASSTPSSSRAR